MHLLILIPALVTCEAHVEMVRVQSLLRDRLRRCAVSNGGDVNVHSCIVFDAVAPQCLGPVLDLDYSVKFYGTQLYPDTADPTGIRRPCEHALVQLARTFKPWDSTFVLRIGQDVYVRDGTSLFIALRDLMSRPGEFLAGGLDTCNDIHKFLAQLSIPRAARYRYIQGALMFARLDVWLRHFLRLPTEIVHFCDDSVLSQMVTHAGGELVPIEPCWDHRHGCPPDDSRQAFREHSLELGNGHEPPGPLPALPRPLPPPIRPRLDALAHRNGTDKRSGEHGYTRCYEELWGTRRDEPLTLLEFGIGAGDSLRMWTEYFPNAQIVAVDVADGAVSHGDSRVRVFVGRQEDEALAKAIGRAFPAGFDIIIDDAGHVWPEQQKTLSLYLPLLRRGGDYVIEDLHTSYWGDYSGGTPLSTVEFLKARIDDVMRRGRCLRADVDTDSFADLNRFERDVEWIRFHRSLAVIRKRR